MFSFDIYYLVWPHILWLWPLPLTAYAVSYFFGRSRAEKTADQAIYFPHTATLLNITTHKSASSYPHIYIHHLLLWLIWSLCIIALARPQLPGDILPQDQDSRDIILAVDVSGSMKALDFATRQSPVNRLDVTKRAVSDFVMSRQHDRIGLVIFGSQAFLASPLTSDTVSVGSILDGLRTGVAGDATAIGDALGLAIKHLRESHKDARTIVLLTDGENTAGAISPEQAADIAVSYTIRVHTIAVGKEGRIPFPNGFGGVRMVPSSLDETSLRNIAESTGGVFFRATDKHALSRIYDEIDRLETAEQTMPPAQLYTPLFRYPLLAALFLMIMWYLIVPERRP